MFLFLGRNTTLCDGMSRREWLRAGGLSAFGKAKRCIVLFMLGGPPQHETWDPKPDAPSEIRGDFGTIPTATPGYHVGELMPLTARLTERIAVLRAMATDDNAHSSSGYWMLTDRPHSPKGQENALPGAPNNWPTMASVVRHLKGDKTSLPGAGHLPEEIWNTGDIVWPGQDGGFPHCLRTWSSEGCWKTRSSFGWASSADRPSSMLLADAIIGVTCSPSLWLVVACAAVAFMVNRIDKVAIPWMAALNHRTSRPQFIIAWGSDRKMMLRDPFGRPLAISTGKPIQAIL